ncbi:hypothetical protein, partial [Ralstonia pseudosolanacearum]
LPVGSTYNRQNFFQFCPWRLTGQRMFAARARGLRAGRVMPAVGTWPARCLLAAMSAARVAGC